VAGNLICPPSTDIKPLADRVENDPSAGVVPPTMPSNVPAFMSAVVATKEAIVPSEVNDEANTSAV